MCGIYLIINCINFKVYVGQTKNYHKRIMAHKRRIKSGEHKSYNRLYPAMKKYGIENFAISFFQECPKYELNKRERECIKEFDSYRKGYNATEGGNSSISYWLGKHRSEETKKKLSLANIGKKQSTETIKKISESNKGKHPICYACGWNKGLTAKNDARMAALIRKTASTKKLNGYKHPPEVLKKQSDSMKKFWAIKKERNSYVND